ncbi:MAG: DUF4430 domain-containing protein [Ruminococcaceae bacterium]|nr:DUF4430 domain-containing protein [Oscillospiraceae bacterium]
MKKSIRSIIAVILAITAILCVVSCGKEETPDVEGLWQNTTYKADTELGSGAKTVKVEYKLEEKVITFTIHTDKETVGEALLEHNLISGDIGEFGMYVKVVNGITADYDVDKSYWAFYVNGDYAMSGVDQTAIDETATYQLAYTKE